jgi:hypothetical protein
MPCFSIDDWSNNELDLTIEDFPRISPGDYTWAYDISVGEGAGIKSA